MMSGAVGEVHDGMGLRRRIRDLPLLGPIARRLLAWRAIQRFPGSASYWRERYASGGDSGEGSRGALAAFKAEVVNRFVRENRIETIIEFGCGDGAQLRLAEYPAYLGFDVSPIALDRCRALFAGDGSKAFRLLQEHRQETAQLALSLDVIYHLVEDDVFADHVRRLFDSATEHVIIYSSDTDENAAGQPPHMRHRRFTEWVRRNRPGWRLVQRIRNRHPFGDEPGAGSRADFFLYERISS